MWRKRCISAAYEIVFVKIAELGLKIFQTISHTILRIFDSLYKIEFSRWGTEVTEQKFTSQELAKLKAADPDDVISVRVGQIAELIEQNEQLIEQKDQLIEQIEQLLAKDIRSEEEKAEYRSKIQCHRFI